MISRKQMDSVNFAELQSMIKNHERELLMMKEEAQRRAELVEPKHTPTILYLLEQAMTFYRLGYKIKARQAIQLAENNITEEMSGGIT